MQTAVLFLDHAWRPLRVESWERAIADLFLGKIEVVENSRDRTIRTVSREFPMPSVVRVVRKFKRDRIRVKFSRINIYTRDKFHCQYCGLRFMTEDLNLDHVTPKAQGGRTTWENVVCSCVECNSRKADRTPQQAGMRLLTIPKKPTFLPTVAIRNMNSDQIPVEWRSYWTSALGS